MQELKHIAERIQKRFKLRYDEEGMKFLENYIERSRNEIASDEWVKFINTCGAFLGQCIIEKYGGRWVRNNKAQMMIKLNNYAEVSPFEIVIKQFNNGPVNSVHAFYSSIPAVFLAEGQVKNEYLEPYFLNNKNSGNLVNYLTQMYLRVTSFI